MGPEVHIDRGRLRAAIEDAFTDLALAPSRGFHFISGAPLAERLRYAAHLLDHVPVEAVASFAGVGNPFLVGPIAAGAQVLDVGCGSGTDAIIASRMVGPGGRVLGVDMTPAMIERAEACGRAAGCTNLRFTWGHAEALPVPDASLDLVMSNGVFSLAPSKVDAFREVARVLRPGGEFRIADVVTQWRLPAWVTGSLELWTDCIGGATWIEDYPVLLEQCGFVEVEVVETFDVFRGTTIEKNSSVFEARGANIRAIRG